jgi:SAM-dependent methyltransferase
VQGERRGCHSCGMQGRENLEAQALTRLWDQAYVAEGPTPWEGGEFPPELCRWFSTLDHDDVVLDVGCGRGTYSLWLAKRGIAVHGVDISEAAVANARLRADQLGLLQARFEVADVRSLCPKTLYDFAFDYSVFHHIHADDRPDYASALAAAVRPGGRLGVVCYSPDDPDARGTSSRVGRMGNLIFHPTHEEVEDTFRAAFDLIDRGRSRLGPRHHHLGHHFLFQRHPSAR